MATEMDDALPTALEVRKMSAEKEAEKAAEYMRKHKAAVEAEKKALMEQLQKPSEVTDEERMKRAATIIRRAVDNGLTEVFVGRFPNNLCTDRGRAINQMEAGWETTLTGLPKELFLNSGSSISSRADTRSRFRSWGVSRRHTGRHRYDAQVGTTDTRGECAARRPRSHLLFVEER